MHWGDYGWGMGFGWVWMILVWVLVIAGAVYIIQIAARSGKKQEKDEAPLDILKKRYARGEISKEEFEKMKDDLMKS
jgi:putative membrane protein